MKEKKREKCPICEKYEFPTKDHVPPKCCGNSGKTLIHYFVAKKNGQPDIKESQSGIHYEHICADCNNNVLGSKFDQELKKFCDCAITSKENVITWTGNIVNVVKAIFGHMLATNKYSSCVYDKEMRKFINKNILPRKISLYLFYYPYDATFTIKDAVPFLLFEPEKRKTNILKEYSMFDCLYFSPFAFIIADKGNVEQGVDLVDLLEKENDTVILNKTSWFDYQHNKILPECWPFKISNGKEVNTVDGFIGGGGIETTNISVKKVHK